MTADRLRELEKLAAQLWVTIKSLPAGRNRDDEIARFKQFEQRIAEIRSKSQITGPVSVNTIGKGAL
jgi:hypothetical protein